MSSLSPMDRVSLCRFTFADGRRCRTPRISSHPHFCYYHAQKESRSLAAENLGKDLAFFFSADYLSANDLSTALARLIPAVVRGNMKPRTARTVAYMFQTLLQAIHLSQHEYINAFGSDAWRNAVRNSVDDNHEYRFPPDPEPAPEQESLEQSAPPQPAPPATAPPATVGHPERSEGSLPDPAQSQSQSPTPPPTPAPSPRARAPQPVTQPPQPNNPLPTTAQPRPSTPSHDPHAVHFDHNYQLREPLKLL